MTHTKIKTAVPSCFLLPQQTPAGDSNMLVGICPEGSEYIPGSQDTGRGQACSFIITLLRTSPGLVRTPGFSMF